MFYFFFFSNLNALAPCRPELNGRAMEGPPDDSFMPIPRFRSMFCLFRRRTNER